MTPHTLPPTTRRGTIRKNKAYRKATSATRQEQIREAIRLGCDDYRRVAEYLGVTRDRVRQLTRTMPDLEAVKIGRPHRTGRWAFRLQLVTAAEPEGAPC